jgi:hypothetical protein
LSRLGPPLPLGRFHSGRCTEAIGEPTAWCRRRCDCSRKPHGTDLAKPYSGRAASHGQSHREPGFRLRRGSAAALRPRARRSALQKTPRRFPPGQVLRLIVRQPPDESLVQRAASRDAEETAMEEKVEDMGPRVETQPESGSPSDVTHAAPGEGQVGRTVGADAKGSDVLQAALKKAAAIGNGIQHRREEVIAYARRQPGAALGAAAGFGILVGLALAVSSRAGAGAGSAWLTQLTPRRSFLNRRTGSSRRKFL